MTNIVRWFLPKEEKFFFMLRNQSNTVLKGVKEFKDLINNYPNLSEKEISYRVGKIKEIESEGDSITHNIIDKLNKSFITPFDKEDIHEVTASLDDVLDLINAVSKRLVLFGIKDTSKYIKEFTDSIWKGAVEVDKCIFNLKRLKDTKIHCINIHSIENEADEIFSKSLADLFENNKNSIEVIKYKDIYQFLEAITDKYEYIAHIINSIVVKHD
jgi:predicted phosphate transport protein (TIGR00153 family)